jgi:signal transduction histidine kinase/ActR/RegA family two-component response regulator
MVLKSGEPVTVQHVHRRVDGDEMIVDVSAWPVLDDAGEVRLVIEFSRDVTERTRAEEALRDSNEMLIEALQGHQRAAMKLEAMTEAAEAASRAKSEFLANMSHEIRTPMTAILGFAESLQDPDFPELEKLNAIHTIRRNGEHLLRIINDVLDLSKIEASRLEFERVNCRPRRIVEEVVATMRVRSDDADLALVVEQVGRIPRTIETDPLRLRQILVNLIGNALKFTERGGVRVVLQLLPHGDGSAESNVEPLLRFDVIDTGIGMTPEELDRLFRPFVQGDSSTSRRFGGTGLGLSISKRMAHMLGGDITVTSRVGAGSTFTLTIATGTLVGVEMLEEDSADHVVDESTRPSAPVGATRLVGRVLLAEDGLDNQRLVSFVLKKAGAQVTVVSNGKLAVDAALAAEAAGMPYGVILMDMQMPVMDGYQAATALRQKGYKGTIIALTAHAMASDREKCIAAGCDNYTTKPINREELVRTLATYMDVVSNQDTERKTFK